MFLIAIAAASSTIPAPCMARFGRYRHWREARFQRWDYAASTPDGGRIDIIGVEHLRDPAAPQFSHIRTAFEQAKPTRVFVEGPDRGAAGDADTVIRMTGESGYTRYLAAQSGIKAQSLEPSPIDQAAALAPKFPADRIVLFFILREATRLRDREGKTGPVLDAAVTTLLMRATPMFAKASVNSGIVDLDTLQSALVREGHNLNWRTIPANWFTPAGPNPIFAAINAADSEFRNRHMTALFVDAARARERVFVVVGRNHVPMIAPVLACALR